MSSASLTLSDGTSRAHLHAYAAGLSNTPPTPAEIAALIGVVAGLDTRAATAEVELSEVRELLWDRFGDHDDDPDNYTVVALIRRAFGYGDEGWHHLTEAMIELDRIKRASYRRGRLFRVFCHREVDPQSVQTLADARRTLARRAISRSDDPELLQAARVILTALDATGSPS